jgi:CheY-like chemotaxis protein
MKILYVDDDLEDREIFQEAIRTIDPKIIFAYATSCDEALFKLKSQKSPALIFLDINMPGKTGKECLKAIKSNPLLSTIPVIIFSTSNSLADIKECMDIGASEYLVKPSGFRILCDVLRTRLKSQSLN